MEATRQLAAIMFTDIEGYTALMNRNEAEAITCRQRHREVIERLTLVYNGKILQYYGDGTLSIFPSVINAVNAAIEMQSQYRQHPKVPLRIGIHLGDVIIDDSGVYGDGVNIASRIESFAVVGSVFISDKVFDEIKNQPSIEALSMGLFDLKNVPQPVEIFVITNEGLFIPQRSELKGKAAEPKNKLAVLPFVNMSNDPNNEYFSDGISEELINSLTKIDGLHVTSRTSSFTFKGKNQDVREIGRLLNVSRILEGSVRKSGNRVRITAQLLNAADGDHVWSETYDRDLADIFAVQDEISSIIANRMREQMVSKAEDLSSPVQNTDAYQLYLKGLFFHNKGTTVDHQKAIEYFEQAIALEPTFANAYAMMASSYSELAYTGFLNVAAVIDKLERAAHRAVELNSHLPQSYLSLAMMQLYLEFRFDAAYNNIKKAMLIAPNSSEVHYVAAHYFMIMNDKNRMIEEARLALHSDPLSLIKNNLLGEVLMYSQQLEEAEKQILKTIEMDPKWRSPPRNLAFIYLAKGDLEKCLEVFDRIRGEVNQPGKGMSGYVMALVLLGRKEEAEPYLHQVLKRAEEDTTVSMEGDLAAIYSAYGYLDKVFAYLNAGYDKRVASMLFVIRYPLRKFFEHDERYGLLLDRLGLRKYYLEERISP